MTASLAQTASPAKSSLNTPMFAGVSGDGASVGFSWWAVKGATGYEMLRSPSPQQNPTKIASLPNTTLGYRDTHPARGSVYYQLVAIGAHGARVTGEWVHYEVPSIKSASVAGTDVLVTWSGVSNAPGGYEIWRATNPPQRAVRVGAVSSTTLTYRDKQAGTAPFSYQIVAIEHGVRAASPWLSSISTATSGSDSSNNEKSALAAELAQALENAGVALGPDDLTDIANALTNGGQSAMTLASFVSGAIAQPTPASQPRQTPTGGDPTNLSQGNTTPSADGTSSQQQVDPIVAKLSLPQNSQLEISQVLIRLLSKAKKK
jgi:hypothetical protein